MRTRSFVLVALSAAAALPVGAQQVIVGRPSRAEAGVLVARGGPPRAVIGITTRAGDARDTLGLVVTDVAPNSPADRAGIHEGDRLASINGVSLKLASVDVGDDEMADAISRRLTRELEKLKPGDEVSLVVYSAGKTRTAKVKTASADDVYPSPARRMQQDLESRAALGVSIGSTGSKRDTLGVLVMGVDDGGPADKAGLEEGNRIASINGVDLRVDRADLGDDYVSAARVRRLQRELQKVKPGDQVTLQVYADGRSRTVQLKAVKASELKGRNGVVIFNGAGAMPMPMPALAPMPDMPPMPPGAVRLDFEPQLRAGMERAQVQMQRALKDEETTRTMQRAMQDAQRAMMRVQPVLARTLRGGMISF